MKKKIIVIIVICTVISFLLLNIIWFIFINIQYKPYEEIVPLTEQYGAPVYYRIDAENPNIQYGFDYPGYLQFESNLFYREEFPEDKVSYSFIIWPRLFSTPKYGVIIRQNEEEHQIELNENMKVDEKDKGNEYAAQIIKEHEQELTPIFIEMKKTFNLKHEP